MNNPSQDLQRFLDGQSPKMSQDAFGKSVGVTQPTVNKWLQGHARPSLRAALKIERMTKIPAEAWNSEWAALRRRVA